MKGLKLLVMLMPLAMVASSEAAYKRGKVIWQCDFSRASVERLGNKEIAPGKHWAANEGLSGDGAFCVSAVKHGCKVGIALPNEALRGRVIQIEATVKGLDVEHGDRGVRAECR